MDEKGVTVRMVSRKADLPVQGDRVQLQQVVMNLVLNAIEAMSSVEEAARELSIAPNNGERMRSWSRYDSGPGIETEHLERVFESFYTTKPNGMGMGSRSATPSSHGGRLWACE